jgi:hypothetical protein
MSHTTHSVNLSDLGKTRGFPHRGWDGIGVADLTPDNLPADEVAYGTCQACGKHPIRFVHTHSGSRRLGRRHRGRPDLCRVPDR